MVFNVNEFKSNIDAQGVAKVSDFACLIYPSRRLNRSLLNLSDVFQQNFMTTDVLALRIDSAEFPGRQIATAPLRHYGTPRNIGMETTYPPVTLTCIVSHDFREKEFFEAWQDLIVGRHRVEQGVQQPDSHNIGYYDNYTTSIDIVQFDRYNPASTLLGSTGARFLQRGLRALDGIQQVGQFLGTDLGLPARIQTPSQVYRQTLREAYPIAVNTLPATWAGEDFHRLSIQIGYRYYTSEVLRREDFDASVNTGGFFQVGGPSREKIGRVI